MNFELVKSRLIYSAIIAGSLLTMRCASKSQPEKSPEPVAAKVATSTDSPDGDLPVELRNAENYDPASSIDKATIETSDFNEVKKEVELNRGNIDKEWKAQNDLEESVKKAKEAEKLKKEEEEKKESKAREEARLKAIKEYNVNKPKEKKYIKEANARVKKMPTITKEEVLWNGLED
jgi:hypothetical protein